ncbi:MAG: COX15/CtaA family protein [Chthoniobacteraceae bacterium]
MNETGSIPPTTSIALARFAKLVVFMLFVLILIGGHTTTSGAGMAFPDWPLSHGSVNPNGWWENVMQRLEHGHRLTAETVGLLIGILCAWVWRSKWSVPIAAGVSVVLACAAKFSGAEPKLVAHTGLWSSAVVFALLILWQSERGDHARPAAVRWLAFAAFLGVLAQAIMGGLRVTIEAGGDPATATTFRVLHGCFAQLELAMVVALAAMLSPVWPQITSPLAARSIAILGWITASFIFLQLIVGATMRHLGAGLAIASWPQTSPAGGWMPANHNTFVDLNFAHTRVGAAAVALLVIGFALRTIGHAGGEVRLIRPAALLVALVTAQFTLGVFVIWKMRPPVLTTLHVVNGAALLAATVLLAVRAGRAEVIAHEASPSSESVAEVIA